MKTNKFLLVLASFNLLLFSCDEFHDDVIPSGKITSGYATYSDYDMIDASNAFTVYVSFSDVEESIEIEANENLHQYIEVKKSNNRLEIGIEPNVHIRGSATLNAYITTKNISRFEASGASRFIVEDVIDNDDAYVYLSGASSFTGELMTDQIYADLSGASVMNVIGSANHFDVEVSGASVLRDYDFETKNLKADLSGASNMYVTVVDEIDVEASGASSLFYKGSAVITHQDISGASSVKKMN